MRVLPDESGHVHGYVIPFQDRWRGEQFIDLLHQLRSASLQGGESFYVVRHEEAVLPGCPLDILSLESMLRDERVEWFDEPSGAVFRTHEACRRIEEVLVVHGPFHVICMIFRTVEFCGDLCNAPVIKGVFERVGHAPAMLLLRNVPEANEVRRAALQLVCALLHRLVGLFPVEAGDAFQDGIRDDGDRMVPGHGIGFPGADVPYRQQSVVVVERQHAVDHVGHPAGLGDGEQGVQRPESVPEGEYRVFITVSLLSDCPVMGPVTSVGI